MLKRLAVAIWPELPSYRARFGLWLGYRRAEARIIGVGAALRLWFARTFETRRKNPRLARLNLSGFRFPLHFRTGGSDPEVIDQIFLRREYACIVGIPDMEYIVDCGANIGCSTFFLLHHYPQAKAIVVEPDPGNMAVCRRNLAPFGDRVTFVMAGVWSSAGGLKIERGGQEWDIRVRLAKPGESADVRAVTIGDLIRDAGFSRIDLLKVDIEGSEAELFGNAESSSWLARTRNLVIELHGPECERIVGTALGRFSHREGRSGELTVYREIGKA